MRWSIPWRLGTLARAATLLHKLVVPAHRQGRVSTVQRWFRWLEDQGGIEGQPMVGHLLFHTVGRMPLHGWAAPSPSPWARFRRFAVFSTLTVKFSTLTLGSHCGSADDLQQDPHTL
jgi:hypothetical protein